MGFCARISVWTKSFKTQGHYFMFFQNVQWRDDLEPVMHQKHVLKNT